MLTANRTVFASVAPAPDTFRPQMTSLIDILTLLVVFLIQSFSADGDLITQLPDVKLPQTACTKPVAPALNIGISKTSLLADGAVIAPLSSFAQNPTLLVESLDRWLRANRPVKAGEVRDLVIQCDRDIDFNVVKRVMYTCTNAGFTNLAVLAEEGT